MSFGRFSIPKVENEPTCDYKPGTPETEALKNALKEMKELGAVEIPCIIDGKEIKTGNTGRQPMPSDHAHTIANYHIPTDDLVDQAIAGALQAKAKWEALPFHERANVFLRAAELLSQKYKYKMMAATMLGQAKTCWQAEIDCAAELCDFWRFNVKCAEDIYAQQPPKNATGIWNRLEYRPLEGFIVAVSPFNFTAIGGNLPSAPALMGNVVIWKPSETAAYSNYLAYKILEEAGLPAGVIQFLPGPGKPIGDRCFAHPEFAGLHFTGSTATFNHIYQQTAQNIGKYKSYPRIVGETGGKNFHFVHESADMESVVMNTVRGAFEFQGQKCSATSRMYVPSSLYPAFKKRLVEEISKLPIGQPDDFKSFMSAVIDQKSFDNIKSYIDFAREASDAEIICGGTCDSSKGYFVHPTVIETSDPLFKTMREEIFGPVLTIVTYDPARLDETLELVDKTAVYGLTGAIFARDRHFIDYATHKLRNTAGNFYVNDKCTGAVVGQQPFGGARGSGTNDKAGYTLNVLRWVSPRAIKENYVPLGHWSYPHMH